MVEAEGAPSKTLLTLCIGAILAVIMSYSTYAFTAWGGDDGLRFASTSNASILKVSSVSGPAERAGIKVGDTVERRALPVAAAGQTRNAITRLTITRNGRTTDLTIAPIFSTVDWQDAGRYLAELWTALFALLIAMRGRRWPYASPLSLILALGVLTFALFRAVLPWSPLTAIAHLLGTLGSPLTFALLVRYFASIAMPIVRVRAVWSTIAYCAAAVSALAIVAHFAASATGMVPYGEPGGEFELYELLLTSPIVPCFICGILAWRSAAPLDAPRVGWIVAAYGTFWCFWLFAGPLGFVWMAIGGADLFSRIWGIEQVAHILVPLILSYAALSRRLFDVGFVVSRTVVFGALSVMVVGCFVMLEWAIGKWFENVSHTTSLALNAALALGLGLSMSFLHRRVDTVVDNVFFRRRYENERALRRFANEAMFITNKDALLDRTAREIGERSEASFAAVRLVSDLPANDPAILALQTWREPIDLTAYKSALRGEYAFPMLAHAEFIGAIVCGEKKNGEHYAPDEIETLNEVARGVGIALWSLGIVGDRKDVSEEILARLEAIEQKLMPNGGLAEIARLPNTP